MGKLAQRENRVINKSTWETPVSLGKRIDSPADPQSSLSVYINRVLNSYIEVNYVVL